MMELDEQISVEYDKADALSGRCDIRRDTLLGWKNEAAQLGTELADYKKHFEPRMIQIRLHRQAVAHQEKTYEVGPDMEMKPSDDGELLEMED